MKSTYYDCDTSAFMLFSFSEIFVRAIANCTEPLAHHSPPRHQVLHVACTQRNFSPAQRKAT
jgi:hypothetical protein